MLGFQAEAAAMMIFPAGFAVDLIIQKITRIKLNSGLRRKNFHYSAAARFAGPGRQAKYTLILV